MTEIMLGKILQTQAENARNKREDMRHDLGRQLTRALGAKGAYLEEISRRTGLTPLQISRILLGLARPDDATLEELFTLLTEFDLAIEIKEAE